MLISKLKKHEEYILNDLIYGPTIVEYRGKHSYRLQDGKSWFEYRFTDYSGTVYALTLRQVHQMIHCKED